MKTLPLVLCVLLATATVASGQNEKPKPKPKPKAKAKPVDLKTLAEEAKKNPDGKRTIRDYVIAYSRKFSEIYRKDFVAAEKLVDEFAANLKEIKPTEAAGNRFLAIAKRYVSTSRRRIASAKLHKSLIGKPAEFIKTDTWVNGSSLSPNDFKGKVVLLDFGAIWCGPCIKQFPNLRKWHAKWADKGLLIVGVTRQYNYTWDEKANRPKRVNKDDKEVPLKEEAAMLKKFTEKYKLEHRFAILPDTSQHKKYGVVGIPQIVVVDQKGIIRLILAGATPDNAKAIKSQLEKLLGTASTSARAGE